MEEDKKKEVGEKKPQEKKPVKKCNDDFKRKYFEFYDDIKISDRQDW